MSFIRDIKEKVNIFLYNNKRTALSSLRVLSVFAYLAAVALSIFFYGYPHTAGEEEEIISAFKGLFGYYIFSYGIRFLYSFELKQFIKDTWIEAIFLALLTLDAASYFLTGTDILRQFVELIGFENGQDIYVVFMQVYLLGLAILEVGKIHLNFSNIRVNPAVLFIIIFAGIIFAGAGLLMLPEMTFPRMENGVMVSGWNFIDALFTSASATCVTGLMVEETHTFFTFKGHLVIMGLIKLGGLNIVAFGLFMAVFSRFGIRVKQHDIIEDIVNRTHISSAEGLFGKILVISTAIEIIGATCLFFTLPDSPEIAAVGDRIFYALFHSVSAFNNAGISLYEGGITNPAVAQAYPVLSIMSVLIFLGALGFVTILDLVDIQQFKERMMKPWKTLPLGSRIGLVSNTHLLIFGVVGMLVLEWTTGLFTGESVIGRVVTSVFQIVNRTAGFASVDTGALSVPLIFLFLLLMFIGGSSSSTAGGIKTSTFTLLFVSVWATIRGKKNAELYKKNISSDLLIKAYAVLLFTLVNLFLWLFLLTITERDALASGDMNILQMVFEEFSAFSTVGLSMGITAEFSDLGKIILSCSMFIGRLGTLMLIMALSQKAVSNKYKYPDAHIMIG